VYPFLSYVELFFTLIPLYSVGAMLYLFGTETVMKQVKISVENQMEAYINDIESEFFRILNLSNELVTDKNLHRLSVIGNDLSDIEKMECILSVGNRLVSINQSSQYILNSAPKYCKMTL
jgi:two-component system, sensor histidine kinase YesM